MVGGADAEVFTIRNLDRGLLRWRRASGGGYPLHDFAARFILNPDDPQKAIWEDDKVAPLREVNLERLSKE